MIKNRSELLDELWVRINDAWDGDVTPSSLANVVCDYLYEKGIVREGTEGDISSNPLILLSRLGIMTRLYAMFDATNFEDCDNCGNRVHTAEMDVLVSMAEGAGLCKRTLLSDNGDLVSYKIEWSEIPEEISKFLIAETHREKLTRAVFTLRETSATEPSVANNE